MQSRMWWMLIVFGLLFCDVAAWAEEDKSLPTDSNAWVNFFENRIRPVLIEHCYECHSAETESAGGLLLDTHSDLRSGGDSGPVIVEGNSTDSLLIRAILYDDPQLQMPPTGKLPAHIVDDFRKWIDHGALDPRKASPSSEMESTDAERLPLQSGVKPVQHWAYVPISSAIHIAHEPGLPPGKGVDYWVNDHLSARGLQAEGGARPEVLVRRLYFDLIGLPPTADQLSRAIQEVATGRTEILVDRLLASSHYGETQARHWMDVVRYADSITLRGFVLPHAWRYRDYLVSSFNQDRSFATMIREQIAGDLMHSEDLTERTQQLIATAFLAMGNTNLETQDKAQLDMDYLDEQLDVLGSAFLGQTLGCARCHDHKFDPISTRDYYAMAGMLRSSSGMKHANVSNWIELPLPLDEQQSQHFDQLEQQQKALKVELGRLKAALDSPQNNKTRIPADSLPGIVVDNSQAKLVGRWIFSTHTHPLVGLDYLHDANEMQGEKSATFEPVKLPPGEYEVRLAYQPGNNRASRVVVKVFSADGDTELLVDQRKRPTDQGLWTSLGRFRFEQNGQAYVLISNAEADGHVILDAVQFLPVSASATQADTPDESSVATHSNSATTEMQDLKRSIQELEQQIASVSSKLQQRPMYLTVLESGQQIDLAVHIRGSVHSLGEVVPRGFPTAIGVPTVPNSSAAGEAGHSEGSIETSSGLNRLDLANWIASDSNPLTARVYVNRIWLWMMGCGIVNSPNNFGTTGENPSHPELLDWLASRLIESGWSTKTIIREIVLSQAYQRSADTDTQSATQVDPDNSAYWRGHHRRISAESLRDAMLVVSGELDTAIGGSLLSPGTKTDYDYSHDSTRRSIYQPVLRNSLPELYQQFDFANPSVSIAKRDRSTHAMQGLGLANNPWVIKRARQAAMQWSQRAAETDLETAAGELMISCFGRLPTVDEVGLCVEFLKEPETVPTANLSRWELLVQSLFSSLDFRFVE